MVSMPFIARAKKLLATSGSTTAMVRLRCLRRLLAYGLGWKFIFFARSKTRCLVGVLISQLSRRARDTVETDKLSSRANCFKLTEFMRQAVCFEWLPPPRLRHENYTFPPPPPALFTKTL